MLLLTSVESRGVATDVMSVESRGFATDDSETGVATDMESRMDSHVRYKPPKSLHVSLTDDELSPSLQVFCHTARLRAKALMGPFIFPLMMR